MDTNSNIPAQQVVDTEILYLNELGYGPFGKHTRKEWREECLENLQAGALEFKRWQKTWSSLDTSNIKNSGFDCKLTYSNGEIENYSGKYSEDELPSCTLDFSGYTFSDVFTNLNFEFLEVAIFTGSTFNGGIMLFECTFKKYTNFSRSFFNVAVIFDKCRFEDVVNFRDAIFSAQTEFTKDLFNKYVNFSNVIFKDVAIFESVEFKSNIDFLKTSFHSSCRFHNRFDKEKRIWSQETTFGGSTDFENAVFKNVGHFERVKFIKYVPSFLGADTAATRLEFSNDGYFPASDLSERAVKRYGHLKRLSDEHGQTDQALMFNALELNAKAKLPDANILFKFFTWLYEKASNYGRSFAKPLFWYGVLICLSAMFAMIYSTYSDSPAAEQQVLCKPIKDQPPPLKLPYGRAVAEYAMFRAGGLMDFTDTGKQNNAVNCRLFEEPIEPPLMRAWGIFKGIASIALLFLAALGLRNKYRIK